MSDARAFRGVAVRTSDEVPWTGDDDPLLLAHEWRIVGRGRVVAADGAVGNALLMESPTMPGRWACIWQRSLTERGTIDTARDPENRGRFVLVPVPLAATC